MEHVAVTMKTDADYIKAGVLKAEGWTFLPGCKGSRDWIQEANGKCFNADDPIIVDHLAAQLARQAVGKWEGVPGKFFYHAFFVTSITSGDSRGAIRDIIDSGALE